MALCARELRRRMGEDEPVVGGREVIVQYALAPGKRRTLPVELSTTVRRRAGASGRVHLTGSLSLRLNDVPLYMQ